MTWEEEIKSHYWVEGLPDALVERVMTDLRSRRKAEIMTINLKKMSNFFQCPGADLMRIIKKYEECFIISSAMKFEITLT